MKIELELTDEQAAALFVMLEEPSVAGVFIEIADVAVEAIRRKGSWQRDAMVHIFSFDWESRLEPDPENRGLRRVKATPPAGGETSNR